MTTRKASRNTDWSVSHNVKNRYRHHSDSGHTYSVVELKSGQWQCSCPAWTHKSVRCDCKHIRHIKEHCGR